MNILNKIGYWCLVVLSVFYCSSCVFIVFFCFMFIDCSLCVFTIVSFFMCFFDVRLSHLNMDYFLTSLRQATRRTTIFCTFNIFILATDL